jgi:iron(III) transport system ATP-binding protein
VDRGGGAGADDRRRGPGPGDLADARERASRSGDDLTRGALVADAVGYTYDDAREPAVRDVSLALAPGEHVAILGASGCGKTTFLRLIAGFERVGWGRLAIDGRTVDDGGTFVPPEARRVAMVFQDLALFPHLTLEDNVAFGLAGRPRDERTRRLREMFALAALDGLERRYPHEVSGGQRQRTAVARALAPGFPLLLLDEPLSSLDPSLRADLRADLSRLMKQAGVTTLVVTHDREDALAFADRIGVMHQGRLEQVGSPRELVSRPASRAVAVALDEAWFLPAERVSGGYRTEAGVVAAGDGAGPAAGDLLLRTHDVDVVADPTASARLIDRVFRGRDDRGVVRLASGREIAAVIPSDSAVRPGDAVALRLRPRHITVFAPE